MPKVRAILFDLDNTLVDFIKMKEESCKEAVHAMIAAGLRIPESEAYERLIKTYFTVGIESDNAFSEFLKSEGQFNHKVLAAGINAYLAAKIKCLEPYPSVKKTLKMLQKKGIIISIVTDAPKTKAYQRLLGMDIEHFFKFVIAFEDTNNHKSTGLPLLRAFEMLKGEAPDIKSEEILMVGDSMERDIIPAKKLGLQTALSKYGQKNIDCGNADYVLIDFSDLLDIT